jgi:hypothetical protein
MSPFNGKLIRRFSQSYIPEEDLDESGLQKWKGRLVSHQRLRPPYPHIWSKQDCWIDLFHRSAGLRGIEVAGNSLSALPRNRMSLVANCGLFLLWH